MQGLSSRVMQRGVRRFVLLLATTLVVWLGFKDVLLIEDSAADVIGSADLVVMTNSTWFDDFQDASGLSVMENVQISGGQLRLASDALLGSATSAPISPTSGVRSWGRLYFMATVPPSTALVVDVLDTADVPLMHGVPSGGSLAGIDAETHPVLKLRATLSSTVAGGTPRLDEWHLNWIPDYPNQVFLPVAVKSYSGPIPTPPPLGAAIGYTGANGASAIGKTVRFPSLRKNDAGWDSSFAVQNITSFAMTLTLEFFRENGTLAWATDGIPLRPHGTYIASLADFPPLADGSYALSITATETIVGIASTRHATGTMALAYNGTSQGSQEILAPLIGKGYSGWTSRLCVHNLTSEAADVENTYYNRDGFQFVRRIVIPGSGFDCTDLEQAPWLPFPFVGAARITSEDAGLAATVEHIESQENRASGYLGFDLSTGSDTIYISRCRKENGWQTDVLVSATDVITVSYNEFDGSIGYTRTYPPGTTGFPCPDESWMEPPPFPQNRLGSAVVSTNQDQMVALATDVNASSGTDVFSYPGLSVPSIVAYVPNVGTGLDNWRSTLSIQNPNAVTNTVALSFYSLDGDVLYSLSQDLPPHGMGQYEITQLPGLSVSYEGSVIISATTPVAVLVSKER